MKIIVKHETEYSYDTPATHAVQRLALTPTDNPGQKILNWSVEAPGIDQAATYTDGFGNIIHLCSQNGPADGLRIVVSGEVETTGVGGVIGETRGEASPSMYLRETEKIDIDEAITDFTANAVANIDGELNRMHAAMNALYNKMEFQTGQTSAETTAPEAFAAGKGVCQDFSHILIAMARQMNIPARYVTGYLLLADEAIAEAQHAWAEAWIEDLGWVGFDAANDVCPTERYIRLGCGLDSNVAAPIRGSRIGSGYAKLAVTVDVHQAGQQ